MRIDLNADLGEGYGPYRMGDDAALLDIVTSANVACGFHAGDPGIMVATARAAKARGVALGAHPGFDDRRGFGRRVIRATPGEIEADVAYQIGALQACAALAGHRVTHVKAHGALANLSNAEDDVARAIARAVRAVDDTLVVLVMPGLAAERAAEAEGLRVVREIYADRAYAEDGQLAPRGEPGSVITDPEAVAARTRRMVEEGALLTLTGRRIPVSIDTVCVHGDDPHAVDTARALRRTLEEAGFTLAPFAD
ncbi:MAG: 5-oxoprolinase subunit PxpA [Methylobacterium sp.]|uniref:LamB/YcsF family protein n=1 Tax=unclassified Methylobacterium TaxID=2615210 RepID=UPI0011C76ADD|nr:MULTISPECIES: 5-oxoprolinase subunit PxpA [unclassified Methylobacterium]MDO9425451.1 5-oxoprolinase subunit PxpA [Methylobacterium sp.]TXM78664.1 5-oxoprolinase subunit PxpA [Methylobacterium sp. WL69]